MKNIAKEEGISVAQLDAIAGSGKDGRVTKDDILKYLTSVTNKTANDIANDILEIIYNKLKRRSEPVDKLDEIKDFINKLYDYESTPNQINLLDKIQHKLLELKLD